ncbi:DUF1479-domain-containing protein [Daedalea quercina L-15889]|uniref:DUF1479-domain-containing protein n=1 Tax=Daedalea quercina L-15889 TaxID=1314783 RepID=A0A165QMN7_9APHY|nr:DUF1479-domain-containing protein [Daedalea quercina L-15889]
MLSTVRGPLRPRGVTLARSLKTVTSHPTEPVGVADHVPSRVLGTPRRPKKEGNITNVFGALEGDPVALPERFAALKRQLCTDPGLMEARWRSILSELEKEVGVIAQNGNAVVPQVSYSDIVNGLSEEQVQDIKKRGVVIVRGGVPREEALGWKQSILDYVAANGGRVKGAPPDRIVFYELYQSSAQLRARAHPALVATQTALLGLWHNSATSTSASWAASLRTPIAYFDRLRIRAPGPSVWTLGPHVDSGGVERWEDPGFRACFTKILELTDADGRPAVEAWKEHDAFDVMPRLGAKQDLYDAPNQCSVFRPWQGWTALSSTGPREGTLQVVPMLTLASAYVMLRPFFSRRPGAPAHSLAADDWVLDLESTAFPGSVPGKAQEMNSTTHPHLCLEKTLVSIPRVEPGDQVYWHCDVIHAVESEHSGVGDSSVLYIPAIPLTMQNALYLRDQRDTFTRGVPSPDFPGGEGESQFVGRVTVNDVKGEKARRMFGLAPFNTPADASPAEKILVEAANSILY